MTSYELIYRNGKQRGETVSLDNHRLVVGRNPDCDLVLQTSDVSRRHCMIVRHAEGIYIRDLSSRNGTKVNGVDIANVNAVKLKHRDKVQVGKWRFRMIEHTGSGVVQPNPVAAKQGDLLDELDAMAASLQINVDDTPPTHAVTTVREIDGALLKEAVGATLTDDPNEATTQTDSGLSEEEKSSKLKLVKEGFSGAENDRQCVEQESDEQSEEGANREPAKLPIHLRPQGPIDSQDAAEQALRRMFGS